VLCGTAGGLVQGDELGTLHVSPSMTAPKQRPTAGTTSRPPDSVPQSRLNDRLNPVYFFSPVPFLAFYLGFVFCLSFFLFSLLLSLVIHYFPSAFFLASNVYITTIDCLFIVLFPILFL